MFVAIIFTVTAKIIFFMERTIIVTGVTGSVGRATAAELAQRPGIRLVVSARNASALEKLKAELQAKNPGAKIDTLAMDLGDILSVKNAINQVREKYPSLYAIVNIAAVYKSKRELSPQNNEMMFAINQLGPFQFTTGLTDKLDVSGGVVLSVAAPSSTKTDFDNINGEKEFKSLRFFGASKMQNLLFTFALAKKFEDTNHAAIAFHPGLVKSELLKEASGFVKGMFRMMSSKPEVPAKTIADLIEQGETKTRNGKFFNKKQKPLRAAAYAYETGVQNKLWETCENLIQKNVN